MPEIDFVYRIFPGDKFAMESIGMLIDILLIGGMTLAALIALVLLKTRKRFSQRLPVLFFSSGFFFLLYYYSFVHRSAALAAIAILFGNGMGFLLGPVLYYYIKSITLEKARIVRPLLRQLIPYFAFWLTVSLPLAINLFREDLLTVYADGLADQADYFNLVENVFLAGYCLVSLRLIGRLQGLYSENYSAPEQKNIDWCRRIVLGLLAILVIDSGLSVYELAYPPEVVVWNIGLVVAFAFVAFFAYLGYHGMFQTRILLPDFLIEKEFPAKTASGELTKTATTSQLAGLSDVEIRALQQRLTYLLEVEKVYLDENLTLGQLAERIGISDKKLSELLNRFSATNFYNLINDHRIAHAKKMLIDPRCGHLTVLGMGFESGFNSKTSFNRVFKQKTGMSPSAYKKEYERQSEKEVALPGA